MGILQWISSLQRSDITSKKTIYEFDNKLKSTHVYIDFNSIIYTVSTNVLNDLNYILYCILYNELNELNEKSNKIMQKYKIKIYDDPKLFSDIYNTDILDQLILDNIVLYVIYILSELIDQTKIKYLYMAIDGTPTKSKIIDQKKRRYMGLLSIKLEEEIFKSCENELKQTKQRYLFELYKIKLERSSKITPGTIFMDKLHNLLKSDEFNNIIKKICPNIDFFDISTSYSPGEGEKKIVNLILKSTYKNVGEFVIFSPDADVSLLGLILNSHITPLKILRQDQQKNIYNVIDIDLLGNNIYDYINKLLENDIENYNSNYPKKEKIIDDLVFIFTVFGNDFVPKLVTFDVKTDITETINIYIKTLKKKLYH